MVRRAIFAGSVVLIPVLLIAGCPSRRDAFVWQGCKSDVECDDDNACTRDTCKDEECHHDPDDMLVPADDGKPCTQEKCEGGTEKHVNVQEGTPCATGSTLTCDAMGSCEPCTSDAQCGTGSECMTVSCDGGTCATHNVAQGTPAGTQTSYDCKKSQCDGMGGIEVVADTSDVAPYENNCVDHVCNGDTPGTAASAVGTPCAIMGGGDGVCDMTQACKPCVLPAYGCSAGSICVADESHCAKCADGAWDEMETDTDCGGPDCGKCDNGKMCKAASDCTSGNCVDGYCCKSACTTDCSSCGLPGKEGLCSLVPAGYDDTNATTPCENQKTCSAAGTCVGKAGTLCSSGGQCLSDQCTSGTCAKSQKDEPCSSTADCQSGTCTNHICM